MQVIKGLKQPTTTAHESIESHYMAFAAEAARLNGEVINMNDYRDRAEEQLVNKD